jgi:hypothetical protein
MITTCVETQRGVRAWLARKWELVCVTSTLHVAEQDAAFMALQCAALPKQLRQLEHEIQCLRVRQALLRSGQ